MDKARQEAINRELDLVKVAPQANPPVCKIMDFNKYYYEKKKKEKESKKKTKSAQLKQMRLSPNIGKNDLKTKFRKIKSFLKDGHKVKVNMMFKGREKEHLEVGREILLTMIDQLKDVAKCKNKPKFEGFYMSVMLAPDKKDNS